MTPLMCAASAGDLNLVQMLLDADAHPNIAVTIPSDNSQVIALRYRNCKCNMTGVPLNLGDILLFGSDHNVNLNP